MKIFGFPLSPFVRKVAVAAREKGLDYELDPGAIRTQPSEEFLKVSPFGKIPAMSDGDFCLADSTAIVTYLDAKYPEPALLPAEPTGARAGDLVRGSQRHRADPRRGADRGQPLPAAEDLRHRRRRRGRPGGRGGAAQAARLSRGRSWATAAGSTAISAIGDISLACTIKTLGYAGWSLDPATLSQARPPGMRGCARAPHGSRLRRRRSAGLRRARWLVANLCGQVEQVDEALRQRAIAFEHDALLRQLLGRQACRRIARQAAGRPGHGR